MGDQVRSRAYDPKFSIKKPQVNHNIVDVLAIHVTLD